MKILCISASNVEHKRNDSGSSKTCEIIKNILHTLKPKREVQIETLLNYDLNPSIFCGKCVDSSSCIYDKDMNKLFQKIVQSDGFFLVVPHYSIIQLN